MFRAVSAPSGLCNPHGAKTQVFETPFAGREATMLDLPDSAVPLIKAMLRKSQLAGP
jgi:hypothetical protein